AARMYESTCTGITPEGTPESTTKSTAESKQERKADSKTDSNIDRKCVSYRALRGGANISFVVRKPAALDAELADCSVGVCYRVPAPYGIEFAFNNQYVYGTIVNLPNDRPALALPLERAAFVKRVNNVEFENGMLKKVHFEKPSEALEVA